MTKIPTPKQKDFREALLGETRGHIRADMDLAGYSRSTKTAEVVGPLKEEITERAGEERTSGSNRQQRWDVYFTSKNLICLKCIGIQVKSISRIYSQVRQHFLGGRIVWEEIYIVVHRRFITRCENKFIEAHCS